MGMMEFFFFSSRRRHTRYWRDWSSDVCSSDLDALAVRADRRVRREVAAFEVNQYRLLPDLFVGELDRRALRHVGLLSDGRPALDLGNPVVRAPGLVRFRCPFDGALAGGGAFLFGLFAPA